MNTVLIILALVYWCISKKNGTYLMMGWSGNRIANGFMKVTACVYRPWIRDTRIVPYGDGMTTATGYSFPSGHTMNAATIFGGGAVRKEFPKVLRVMFGVMVALVALSRNYLGVHTPQDVLCGAAIGLLVMWLTAKLMGYLEAHPEKDFMVAGIGVLLAILVAVYAALKPYPEDFDAAGKLLVDGAKMANDTFKGVGFCSAFLVGWILERRFVNFTTEVPVIRKITRMVVGLFCFYVVSLIFVPLIKEGIPGKAGTVAYCFVQMFFISFVFPWCMKRFETAEKV